MRVLQAGIFGSSDAGQALPAASYQNQTSAARQRLSAGHGFGVTTETITSCEADADNDQPAVTPHFDSKGPCNDAGAIDQHIGRSGSAVIERNLHQEAAAAAKAKRSTLQALDAEDLFTPRSGSPAPSPTPADPECCPDLHRKRCDATWLAVFLIPSPSVPPLPPPPPLFYALYAANEFLQLL